MNVSVIIPVYNSAATITLALNALLSQDYTGTFEIIVVDDGSTDASPDMIKRFSQVRYLRQDNAGPASARNHGARVALGEFLCFTDSDCIPNPDWVRRLVSGFQSPDIGVVSGSYGIANPESPLARAIQGEIVFRHRHLLPDYPKSFGSYNFCVRKSLFEKVGGFSVSYRQASGEDNDLSYQILSSGSRIFFDRQAIVAHRHTSKMVYYLGEQFRHGFWRVALYIKHPAMARGDDYTFWKDMIEVPLSGVCVVVLVLGVLGFADFGWTTCFALAGFLIFEIISALYILRDFSQGLYFGWVMFLRAFYRTAGLSTGILTFFRRKI